ncbi:MAG: DUF4271 domain-containing protein [Flavobacteriales bacterium]
MFLVPIVSLIIVAYSKSVYPNRFKNMWRSIYNAILLRQMIREESNIPKEYILHFANYVMLTGLALFSVFKLLEIPVFGLSGILLYLVSCGIITLLYFIKGIGVTVTSFIINGDFTLSEYRYVVFLINRVLGVILLPLIIMLVYGPLSQAHYYLIAVAGVLFLAYLYRVGKGLINALRSGVGVFYIFFYICTLEILPIIISTKFIMNFKV